MLHTDLVQSMLSLFRTRLRLLLLVLGVCPLAVRDSNCATLLIELALELHELRCCCALRSRLSVGWQAIRAAWLAAHGLSSATRFRLGLITGPRKAACVAAAAVDAVYVSAVDFAVASLPPPPPTRQWIDRNSYIVPAPGP